nr:PREDICTED: olfactory receptor 52K1-like [Lepisosteus oculatus]
MQGPLEGNTSHTDFIFKGFPGFFQHRRFLSIPFLIMFVVATVGNSVLISVLKRGSGLQSPMYILIGALAVVDLTLPVLFVPKMLLNFLFDWNSISLPGCLVQMFFIHMLASLESAILLVMAIDRYVAICNPLRYNDYINMSTFLKVSIAVVIRNGLFISLIVIQAGSLSFCLSNVIEHCYCEHMVLVNLACGNTTQNSIIGLLAIICILGSDLMFICYSYCTIFCTVLKAASGKSRQKAVHTCGTHLIVILLSYSLAIGSFLVYRFRDVVSPDVHNLMSVMYVIFPSCFNPVIYGVRTKEIREEILKTVKRKKSNFISFAVVSIN